MSMETDPFPPPKKGGNAGSYPLILGVGFLPSSTRQMTRHQTAEFSEGLTGGEELATLQHEKLQTGKNATLGLKILAQTTSL